ncbi:transmembrane protein 26b [Paramormyrops kingsleyae]|uniref:Transmembrane protein 26b n=1 Tax=Paramormyrops kingsleyae TaxID=1676925 RepID=A0A3B3R577_9TELE|nr:transmembrane protein 26 [Paramormyrops kingsleyae]
MVVLKFICAVITRLLFILISLIAVWRVTLVKHSNYYWLLIILYLPLILEMIVTLKRRKGMDYTWFSPAIFLFLICIIPSMWILEIHHYSDKSNAHQCKKLDDLFHNATHVNSTTEALKAVCPKDWILALHQILLILLIVGKWLMPIGVDVTKYELSQLLLIFTGTAADILEFTSETISDVKENNPQLMYITLGIWTWSMLQFPLHLSVVNPKTEEASEDGSFLRRHQTDLWNIVESLLIQDGPFLLVRIVIMGHFKLVHQMLLFFTIKNFLVVTLNFYRLYVMFLTYKQPK